jgi:hypothetical protein
VLLMVLLAAGCGFSPKFPGGTIQCGAPPQNQCPGALKCDRGSGLCLADGESAPADAGADGPAGDRPAPPPRPPSSDDCNVLDPAACPAGKTCRSFCVGDEAAVARCEAVGPVPLGQTCSSEQRCGAGAACVQRRCQVLDVVRMCEKVCATDADCPAGGTCRPIPCGGDPFRTCTNPCDPRPGAPATCPAETTCYVDKGDVVGCDCTRAGAGRDGYACDDGPLGACEPGLTCAAERGGRVCRPLCRRDQPTPGCAAGRSCLAVPGFEKWGACVPDPGPDITPSGCDATRASSCGDDRACRAACGGPLNGTATCQVRVGMLAPGQVCAGDLFCAPGSGCVTRSCGGTPIRICQQWCKVDADCGGGSSGCESIACGGQPSPFRLCSLRCEPRGAANIGCPTGMACTLGPGDRTDCGCPPAGGGLEGDPCQHGQAGACRPGHLCVGPGNGATCRRICRLADNDCAGGARCTPVPDHVVHGACLPPSTPAACDPTQPASCPAGNACVVSCDPQDPTTLRTLCVPAGTAAPGQSCVAAGDCAGGSVCLGATCADGVTRRTCSRHCRVDADCGGGTARCLPIACGSRDTPYGRCTASCDPVGASTAGCPSGLTCFLFQGDLTECSCRRPTQVGGDGDPCTSVLTCRPGLTCVHEGPARVCRAICRLEGPSTCAPDRRCTALPDHRAFGACVPTP